MDKVLLHHDERDFLRNILMHYLSDDDRVFEGKMPAGLDWKVFETLANRHGVMPLVYKSLKRVSSDDIPPDYMNRLTGHYRMNVGRNLALTAELLRLQQLFSQRNLTIIPLKGPMLSYFLYGDVTMRQFCDLDLLVDERDLPEIDRILKTERYQIPVEHQMSRTESKHTVYKRHDDGLVLEVHWRLSKFRNPPDLPLEDIWQEMTVLTFGGMTLPFFSPENLVLFLSTHGFRHFWQKLVWLIDVAVFLKTRPDTDWETVFRKARQYRLVQRLVLGFTLVEHVLAVPLPAQLTSQYRVSRSLAILANRHYVSIFQPTKFFAVWFQTAALDHWRDKCLIVPRITRQMLGPSEDDKSLVSLPRRYAFLYYVIKPFLRVWRYVLSPVFRRWKA